MDAVQKIQDAEQQIADLQRTLGAMQSGLEKAEAVATAAEENREQAERLIKVAIGLLVATILTIGLSQRRRTSG